MMLNRALRHENGIVVDVKQQYFEMASDALPSVERVRSQRFRDVGAFDAEGITAQIGRIVIANQDQASTQALLMKSAGADAYR